MTLGFHRETAKIYQFPVRKRAIGADRPKWLSPATDRTAPQAYAQTTFGSGWYHDAAIADEDRKQTS